MRPIKTTVTCNWCGKSVAVTVNPGCQAQTYGDPLDCYPAEPAEVDPNECPECCAVIDEDAAIEAAIAQRDNERASAAEARERRMEEE